jgi:hypothetical protein
MGGWIAVILVGVAMVSLIAYGVWLAVTNDPFEDED